MAEVTACYERPKRLGSGVRQLIDAYLDPAVFRAKSPRTQAAYKKWALRFATEFKDDHCDQLAKVYEVDRAEIVWSPTDIEVFSAKAAEWAQSVLIAACETGLRPGDVIRLSRFHIKPTRRGSHIVIRTNKRKRSANIPVFPEMAPIIDTTPSGRKLILTNASGRPLTAHRAS